MKNIKIYILLGVLLFCLSCDAFDDAILQLDENETDLEYPYYIEEGWGAIEDQNFNASADFFDYIISNEDPSIDSALIF